MKYVITENQSSELFSNLLKKLDIKFHISYMSDNGRDSITAMVFLYKNGKPLGYRNGYDFYFKYDSLFNRLIPDGRWPHIEQKDEFGFTGTLDGTQTHKLVLEGVILIDTDSDGVIDGEMVIEGVILIEGVTDGEIVIDGVAEGESVGVLVTVTVGVGVFVADTVGVGEGVGDKGNVVTGTFNELLQIPLLYIDISVTVSLISIVSPDARSALVMLAAINF